MATKKDLVEAQSFSRRRLTTAFVSGAPGGREVEPHRPLRAVVGGLALTAVLVLGSMAFGWLRSSLPADWKDNRLIIAEDSGARYVSLKGLLHPVVNTTSARLLIPSKDFRVLAVPDEELASIPRGATLGIVGAPDSLTPPERLVNSGWVSRCPKYPGGDPINLAISWECWNSAQSILMHARESPKSDSAMDSTTRVLPDPVGPRNRRLPTGRPGAFNPARNI